MTPSDERGDGTFSCNLLTLAWDGAVEKRDGRYVLAKYTCSSFIILTFVTSTVSNNFSQVDKLWSILPVVYAWMFVTDARTLLMAFLMTVWGIRLTYNFHRRGGYSWPPWNGDEDYRWSFIRQGDVLSIFKNAFAFSLFNLVFISFFQNVLLLLMASPSAIAYTMANASACRNDKHQPLGWLDLLASFLILVFVLIESTADNQQQAFQAEKHRYLRESADPSAKQGSSHMKGSGAANDSRQHRLQEYQDGFCQSGLFAIVRKPHYAAEQAVWLSFFLFSVASGAPLDSNWSILGGLLLMCLFQGSGWMTERISQRKYPKYQEYKRRVPLYVPKLWPMKLQTTSNSSLPNKPNHKGD